MGLADDFSTDKRILEAPAASHGHHPWGAVSHALGNPVQAVSHTQRAATCCAVVACARARQCAWQCAYC